MTLSNIQKALRSLSLEELRELNGDVVEHIKMARKVKAHNMKKNLEVGDRIRVLDKEGRKGTIKKINRTKCKCHLDGDSEFQLWNVPITMLEVID